MSLTPRIAIDAMGGDVGVRMMLAGAAMARHKHDGLRFLLVGDEAQIKAALENHPNLRAASDIIHTDKVVSGEDKPSQALRSGRGSSMGLAIDAVKRGDAGGAGRRRHDADPRRQERKGFLAGRVEKALRIEAGLELFEGLLQGPQPPRLNGIDDELVFAPGRIDGQSRPADEAHPLFDLESARAAADLVERTPENHRPDLAFVVLEGEVDVARRRTPQVGHLPLHPNDRKALLQKRFDPLVERRYGQNISHICPVHGGALSDIHPGDKTHYERGRMRKMH